MSKRLLFSPLRYPGGKAKLGPYIREVFSKNGLLDGTYVEPYAGGASVALEMLRLGYALRVHINDVDPGVHAFWHASIHETDRLCRFLRDVPLTVAEWKRQRVIQRNDPADPYSFDLACSTFFLNRTCRSGILSGGVIGGLDQSARDKIGARFNREDLIDRIRRFARLKDRVQISCMDACELLRALTPDLPKKSLVYLDPPYYVKGSDLYRNYYRHADHEQVAAAVSELRTPWIVTYDDVPEIRAMYDSYRSKRYCLTYSAARRGHGVERIFYSPGLMLPYGFGRYLQAA